MCRLFELQISVPGSIRVGAEWVKGEWWGGWFFFKCARWITIDGDDDGDGSDEVGDDDDADDDDEQGKKDVSRTIYTMRAVTHCNLKWDKQMLYSTEIWKLDFLFVLFANSWSVKLTWAEL